MSPLFGGRKDDDAARERSAAEREAARLERERRRAEREGRTFEPPPAAAEPPAPVEPAAPEPPAPAGPASDDVADARRPTSDGTWVQEPPATPVEQAAADASPPLEEPTWAEPPPAEPGPEPEPVAEEPPPVEPQPAPEPEPEPEPAPEPAPAEPPTAITPPPARVAGETGEQPVVLRRRGAPSVSDLPQVAGPKPRGVPRSRRGVKRALLFLPLLLLLPIAWFLNALYQPFAGDPGERVRVVIPSGSTASQIGDILEEQGIVDSAFFFNLRSRIAGKREDLKAGTHVLQKDSPYGDAITALTRNPATEKILTVGFPEGLSIDEMAPVIEDSGLKGDWEMATRRRPRAVGIRGLGVPSSVRTLEGFLFPAQYELKTGSTVRDLVRQQVRAFERTLDEVDLRKARRANLTGYDVLIIASMIEREAQVAKERRLVSAVIYNRLKQGIPLGIDATIRYDLENWSRPLRVSELERDSPYNTRKRQGLPPTPIGSPGKASIEAAANPANVDYLFYVVKPCGGGAHNFSATDAEFQRDVAAYNKKRDELGGKDPSDC